MAMPAMRVRRRSLLAAAVTLAAVIVAIGVIGPERPAASVPTLPTGWGWESFGGVQVGVPGDWGWGNGSQRIYQWCAGSRDRKPPIVGRPGSATLMGCVWDVPGSPPPQSLLENTGQIVAFEHTHPDAGGPSAPDTTLAEGDSIVVRRNGIDVTIIAEPALRRQIAATVHLVDVDANGCPTTDPVSTHPTVRPERSGTERSLGGVQSVSICQYPLVIEEVPRSGETPAPAPEPGSVPYVAPEPRLLASATLVGARARAAVEGARATPTGSGPNRPWHCMAEYQYGEEIVVLHISHAHGASQMYLRYAGCNHHGFDDGTTVHRLTVPSAAAFLVAGVRVDGVDASLAGLIKLD